MEIKKFSFEIHGDKQGELVSLEEMKNIPFPLLKETVCTAC